MVQIAEDANQITITLHICCSIYSNALHFIWNDINKFSWMPTANHFGCWLPTIARSTSNKCSKSTSVYKFTLIYLFAFNYGSLDRRMFCYFPWMCQPPAGVVNCSEGAMKFQSIFWKNTQTPKTNQSHMENAFCCLWKALRIRIDRWLHQILLYIVQISYLFNSVLFIHNILKLNPWPVL